MRRTHADAVSGLLGGRGGLWAERVVRQRNEGDIAKHSHHIYYAAAHRVAADCPQTVPIRTTLLALSEPRMVTLRLWQDYS